MRDPAPAPGPASSVRSSWATSPGSLGAYSYTKPGSAPARPNLQHLSIPGLFCAAEALSLSYYGSLEGAYETALTAAQRRRDYLS